MSTTSRRTVTRKVKRILKKMGEDAGFSCKNGYRVMLEGVDKPIAYVDQVWGLKDPLEVTVEEANEEKVCGGIDIISARMFVSFSISHFS